MRYVFAFSMVVCAMGAMAAPEVVETTLDDQTDSRYVPDVSCPHCFKES